MSERHRAKQQDAHHVQHEYRQDPPKRLKLRQIRMVWSFFSLGTRGRCCHRGERYAKLVWTRHERTLGTTTLV